MTIPELTYEKIEFVEEGLCGLCGCKGVFLMHETGCYEKCEAFQKEVAEMKKPIPVKVLRYGQWRALEIRIKKLEEALERACGDSCYCKARKSQKIIGKCWACAGRDVLADKIKE